MTLSISLFSLLLPLYFSTSNSLLCHEPFNVISSYLKHTNTPFDTSALDRFYPVGAKCNHGDFCATLTVAGESWYVTGPVCGSVCWKAGEGLDPRTGQHAELGALITVDCCTKQKCNAQSTRVRVDDAVIPNMDVAPVGELPDVDGADSEVGENNDSVKERPESNVKPEDSHRNSSGIHFKVTKAEKVELWEEGKEGIPNEQVLESINTVLDGMTQSKIRTKINNGKVEIIQESGN